MSKKRETRGRALPGIVDVLGRVFAPNPYNIPRWPYKVLHFALNMVLAMRDAGYLANARGVFQDEEEARRYRQLTQDLLTWVSLEHGIADQPPPEAGDEVPLRLVDLETTSCLGVLLSLDRLYQNDFQGGLRDDLPLVPLGQALVAVITVTEKENDKSEPLARWRVAFVVDASGLRVLRTINPFVYQISFYLVSTDDLVELPRDYYPQFDL